MKRLTIILILTLIFCSCKVIEDPERTELIEQFLFDDYARKIHHLSIANGFTPSLTWWDIKILNIDSVTAKYLEYNRPDQKPMR